MLNGSLALVVIAITLYCVSDVLLSGSGTLRSLNRPVWLLIVLLVPLFGGLAWLLYGRPGTAGLLPGSGRATQLQVASVHAGGPANPFRGPEDDPAFIRRLEEQLRRADER